ncbi:cleavage and polyadenylation specificity factor subunit 3 [Anaeramoeba flamelloides]|uniref:Cleavage and polyadenylation specificity factor subunit n=1 Tax=Anaeramoeba flamelloides TaxID=1746091 RepID=A0AAV7YJQ3_9EUKA|nr:cleavage and polyadenylation specificity factor subunit [Anaeramoeba flamelloides]KAJ6248901.1 cleavage and polyadenylation specificity factor subunit 3 [Anaeramoeba flamelloides]
MNVIQVIRKPKEDQEDHLQIMPIGAGSEVGRSSIIVKYKGKTVMFDCGIHPGYSGRGALPYFGSVNLSKIDLVLISHFHLDHCGSLPYLLSQTVFNGRVFMTHPTKAIYKYVIEDYIRINRNREKTLYDESDLQKSMEKIEQIDYRQHFSHNGIKFWCNNAGHVLGAAMFTIEIDRIRVQYSGDFSRHPDRHLVGAETPRIPPDVLIVESTYGIQTHSPRIERENNFTSFVHKIISRGGCCLIPVFALGRAQELLLILEEYWEEHTELQKIPIYYASKMAQKCMSVYRTYIMMMNQNIRRKFASSNPFVFKHIKNLENYNEIGETGPIVVMSSPGSLQSGTSRELFEKWCGNSDNGVILTGYCVANTLAREVLNSPASIKSLDGSILPVNLSIDYVSFSAHTDFAQTSEYISKIKPRFIVLNHGEESEMQKLRHALLNKFRKYNIQIFTPKNAGSVLLPFKNVKKAKMVGQLAQNKPKNGTRIQGLLVKKTDFSYKILKPIELTNLTPLKVNRIKHKQTMKFSQTFGYLVLLLESLFQEIIVYKPIKGSNFRELEIFGRVKLSKSIRNENLILEWYASPINDMIVDSILVMIMKTESNPTVYQTTDLQRSYISKKKLIKNEKNMDINNPLQKNLLMSQKQNQENNGNNSIEKDQDMIIENLNRMDVIEEMNLIMTEELEEESPFIKEDFENVETENDLNKRLITQELLTKQYGKVMYNAKKDCLIVKIDEFKIIINYHTMKVITCKDENWKNIIQQSLNLLEKTFIGFSLN